MSETILATGTYTIENVDRRNDIFLADDTLVAGSSELNADPPLDACWKVIRLRNGRFTISPASQQNLYASWPTTLSLGSAIVTSPTPHRWVVREARVKDTFVISHAQHQLYWGIEDDEEGTPVKLRHPPTGSGNQWRFRRVNSKMVTPQSEIESGNIGENFDSQAATIPTTSHTEELFDGRSSTLSPAVPQSVVVSVPIDGSTVDSQMTSTRNRAQTSEVIDDRPAMSTYFVPESAIESSNVDESPECKTAMLSQPRDVTDVRSPTSTPVVSQGTIRSESQAIDCQNGFNLSQTRKVHDGMADVHVSDEEQAALPIAQPLTAHENTDQELLIAEPTTPPAEIAELSTPTRAAPAEASTSNVPERVTVMIHGNAVDITDIGIDPKFLEALPDDMREEALNQHFREGRSARVEQPPESTINPELLEAIPPEIRAETLQRDRLERTRREPTQNEAVAARPAIRHRLKGHTGVVYSVAYSPDRERIAPGPPDGTICVWDVPTRHIALSIAGHSGWVFSVAFSPDGAHIVSGSQDKTIRISDAQSGTLARILNGHSHWVNSVAYSPDGKRVVSGSNDQTVCIWDVETGRLVLGPLLGHTRSVEEVHFSMDSKQILSASTDGTVLVWDAETGNAIRTFSGQSRVCSAIFSPDSRRIVSGDENGIVVVWDMQSSDSIMLKGHMDRVYSVVFSPDGKRIVSGGMDGLIIVWDAKSGHALRTLTGHARFVRSVAFSPDGKWIVSGSYDTTVRIWDADRLDHMPDRLEAISDSSDATPKREGCMIC